MGMMMMLAACSGGTLTTKTFTSSTTWVAPNSTAKLESLTGKGGSGSPATTGEEYYDAYKTTIITYDSPAYGEDSEVETFEGRVFDATPPADFCDPPTYNASQHKTTQICWRFLYGDTGSTPATTGASTTGFGKTFVGGTGGAATPTTYNNVAVTPGASYPLVIPSGGSITISYYE